MLQLEKLSRHEGRDPLMPLWLPLPCSDAPDIHAHVSLFPPAVPVLAMPLDQGRRHEAGGAVRHGPQQGWLAQQQHRRAAPHEAQQPGQAHQSGEDAGMDVLPGHRLLSAGGAQQEGGRGSGASGGGTAAASREAEALLPAVLQTACRQAGRLGGAGARLKCEKRSSRGGRSNRSPMAAA